MKERRLIVEPMHAKSRTDSALPERTEPRILTVDEKCPKLSVEMEPPIRMRPWIDTLLPQRVMLRSDIEEPN
jgi:hypothetical protein